MAILWKKSQVFQNLWNDQSDSDFPTKLFVQAAISNSFWNFSEAKDIFVIFKRYDDQFIESQTG